MNTYTVILTGGKAIEIEAEFTQLKPTDAGCVVDFIVYRAPKVKVPYELHDPRYPAPHEDVVAQVFNPQAVVKNIDSSGETT